VADLNSLAGRLESLLASAQGLEMDALRTRAANALLDVLADAIGLAASRRDWQAVSDVRARYFAHWLKYRNLGFGGRAESNTAGPTQAWCRGHRVGVFLRQSAEA
jgi:hypothetical protein